MAKTLAGCTASEYFHIFVSSCFAQGTKRVLVTQKGFCAGVNSNNKVYFYKYGIPGISG